MSSMTWTDEKFANFQLYVRILSERYPSLSKLIIVDISLTMFITQMRITFSDSITYARQGDTVARDVEITLTLEKQALLYDIDLSEILDSDLIKLKRYFALFCEIAK